MNDVLYQRRKIDVVSLEALTAAGYEADDGGQAANAFGADLCVDDLLKRLSPRQREVVQLLSEGYTRAEVMQKLGLSDRVNFHRLIVRVRRQLEVYFQLTGQTKR